MKIKAVLHFVLPRAKNNALFFVLILPANDTVVSVGAQEDETGQTKGLLKKTTHGAECSPNGIFHQECSNNKKEVHYSSV